MALPPREDGRAHHRRQGGHGRLDGRGVPAHDALRGRFPRPVGRAQRACEPAGRRTTRASASPSALLLTGHSHQAWPDVALRGPARGLRRRRRATSTTSGSARSPRPSAVRAGFRAPARRPERRDRARRQHARARRSASSRRSTCARARAWSRTDGEFHTLRRQLARLGEAGLEVVARAGAAGRHAGRAPGRRRRRAHRARCWCPSVLFETAHIVPALDGLARACADAGAELLVDAYHALGSVPFDVDDLGLGAAWVVGGGYKYLQLGEGNCFLRLPAHAETCAGDHRLVRGVRRARRRARPGARGLRRGAERFAGSTYDPTSHYRAARVFAFFAEQGLTPERLRASYRHQVDLLAAGFDALGLPEAVITRDRDVPLERFGGFLALRSARAGELQRALAERGVLTDSRGDVAAARPGAVPVRRAARGRDRAPRRCDRRRVGRDWPAAAAGSTRPWPKTSETTISSTTSAPAACARRWPRPSPPPPTGHRGASAPRRSRRPRSPICVRRATRSRTASSTATRPKAQRGREEGRAHAQAQGGHSAAPRPRRRAATRRLAPSR